jgi:fused signal recognition particle receptor
MFSFFKKIKSALTKTRSFLGSKLKQIFGSPLNEETYEKLEQILYEADLGSSVTEDLIKGVKRFLKSHPEATHHQILNNMKESAAQILSTPPRTQGKRGIPLVILIVGVNGSGKTTSIAKLSSYYKSEGKKVMVAAADTFRAGAIDQLIFWAEKVGVDIIKSKPGSDPASVAYDAVSAALHRGVDIVLIDTAGRLQNKTDLMHELQKIQKVCQKVISEAPHEVWMVMDATTGQNGLEQARTFSQFTPLTGIILTKLDGSAKGGVILPLYRELGVPVLWVGVGEQNDDLIPFEPDTYLSGLFENPT